jgi:transcriptional regulator with XRE-family HTH domain
VAFGSRLRTAREAKGLTLAEISTRTGLSIAYLSAIECGEIDPDSSTLEIVVKAFGVTGVVAEGARPFENLPGRLTSKGIALRSGRSDLSKRLWKVKTRFRVCLRRFFR